MDAQFIINSAFTVIGVIAGWFFKVLFGYAQEVKRSMKEMENRQMEDYRKLNEKITNLALSIPEKYVSKNDFDNLVKTVHHRFDRLEEKIDNAFKK